MSVEERMPPACWCGSQPSGRFSDEYLRCDHCGSLVREHQPEPASLRVEDDARDFYGRSYYESHLPGTCGQPSLAQRAVGDLSERCVHWLRTLLEYRTPPADVLEIGSGPGAFVALLTQAGYRATGLELSPTVVEFTANTFGVPVFLGPITAQALPPSSFDVLVLVDVLEHFDDPLATLSHALGALREDGILIVQTPRFDEGSTFDDLRARGDRFLELLKPQEHLFLFSERSIRVFFERLGVPHVAFEPAVFSYYDMFLVASRRPLSRRPLEQAVDALLTRPAARMVRALVDVDAERRRLVAALATADDDRAARLAVIGDQGNRLGEVEGERNRLAAELEEVTGHFLNARKNLADRLTVIEQQGQRLGAMQAELTDVKGQLDALEADRAARLKVILEQSRRLGELEGERNTLAMVVEQARGRIAQAEADRAARLQMINAQGQRIGEIEADRRRLEHELKGRRLTSAGERRRAAAPEAPAPDTGWKARGGGILSAPVGEGLKAALERFEWCLVPDRALEERKPEARRMVGELRERAASVLEAYVQARAALLALRGSRAYRTIRSLGRWAPLDEAAGRVASGPAGDDVIAALDGLERCLDVPDRTLAECRPEALRLAGDLRCRAVALLEAYARARAALLALRGSRAYRTIRSLGRWAPLDEAVGRAISAPAGNDVEGASRGLDPHPELPDRRVEPGAPPAPAAAAAAPAGPETPAALAQRVLQACAGGPGAFEAFERAGLHVTPVSFYSPIPQVAALAARPWPDPLGLEGVAMREEEQLRFLEACREFEIEYSRFPASPPDEAHGYHRDQMMFRVVDAEVLHCMVRRNRPRKVIEVGSGFSTRVTADALLANARDGAPGEFLAIEPYPDETLRAGFPGLTGLRVMDIQDLPADFADGLEANDILFIDSTHVVRTGGDVTFLFLQVLPRLQPGVLVHVHDIFLPAEYPRQWVVDEHRFWTEQYLLHAFLLFNGAFQVEWAGCFMHLRHPDALRRAFPAYEPSCAYPGSFWMRRVTPA
jgi:SAM-dependent methyltransferase